MAKRFLNSQKVDLYKTIQKNGIDPTTFVVKESNEYYRLEYTKNKKLFFAVDLESGGDGEFSIYYFSYRNDHQINFYRVSWEQAIECLTIFLQKEVKTFEEDLKTPDPWKVENIAEVLPGVESYSLNDKFSSEEKEKVKNVFKNHLEPSIAEYLELNANQLKYLTDKFDRFLVENENKTKNEFRNEALKMIIGVGVDLSLEAVKFYGLLYLLGKSLEMLKPILQLSA